MTPFFVLSMPRSRSAWMAAWLAYGGDIVKHDAIATAGSVTELHGLAQTPGIRGFVETAGAYFPRTLLAAFPGAKFLIVRRDKDQVAESLDRLGVPGLAVANAAAAALDEAADWLARRTEVMAIDFTDLEEIERLGAVWRFLRGTSMPLLHTVNMRQMRVTKLRPFDGRIPRNLLLREAELEGNL